MSLVAIFQVLYLVVFFIMSLMSIFIIFHIVYYSYTKSSKMMMLAIFIPVAGVLLFTNLILFFQIPLNDLLPIISI